MRRSASALALFVTVGLGCDEVSFVDSGIGVDTGSMVDTGVVADTGNQDAGPIDTGVVACASAEATVTVTTDDGQNLEAEIYPSGTRSGPGAVLLHMTPSGFNDRTNYPQSFIDALTAKGMTVLNMNRRGVGGPAALARSAYEGPDGKFDAKGGYDFLVNHDCAIDASRIVFVGASNGTTTALDFAVYASREATVEVPAALVFLTGGTYTENNNTIAAERTLLDALPIQFVYSNAESAWSAQFLANAADTWTFDEFDPGGHGTQMFGVQPTSIDTVADFIDAQLR